MFFHRNWKKMRIHNVTSSPRYSKVMKAPSIRDYAHDKTKSTGVYSQRRYDINYFKKLANPRICICDNYSIPKDCENGCDKKQKQHVITTLMWNAQLHLVKNTFTKDALLLINMLILIASSQITCYAWNASQKNPEITLLGNR